MEQVEATPNEITFKNGKLVGSGWKGSSPNSSGVLRAPSLIVLHYTASGGLNGHGDVSYLMKPQAKASAHFVVGRAGDISQIVELGRKAWHAGKSFWNGKANANDFSVGIEIDNWGWLTKRADGSFYSYTGEKIEPARVVEARHKHSSCPQKYWEAYPPVQIESTVKLIKALKSYLPSLTEIVGHEDIAPGRKTDPGPALPWQHILAATEGNTSVAPEGNVRKVNASTLNVRDGAGSSFAVLDKLSRGKTVTEFYRNGQWAHIHYNTLLGAPREGWVHTDYLV